MHPDIYAILEIDRLATNEEVIRAFHRQSQRFHPERAGVCEIAKMAFEQVNTAYNIVRNKEKRLIYDKYGWWGLRVFVVMGEFSPLLDPAILTAFNEFFFILSYGICLLISAPAILGLKSFSTAFVPLFLADFFIFTTVIFAIFVDATRFEGDSILHLIRNVAFKGCILLYFALLGAFEVLLAIKLDNLMLLNWWGVISPLVIWECLNFLLILIPTMFQIFCDGERIRNYSLSQALTIWVKNYYLFFIRFFQTLFLISKLYSNEKIEWSIVLSPFFLLLFYPFFK